MTPICLWFIKLESWLVIVQLWLICSLIKSFNREQTLTAYYHCNYNKHTAYTPPPSPAVDGNDWDAVLPELLVDCKEAVGGCDHGFGNGSRFSSPGPWFLPASPVPSTVHQSFTNTNPQPFVKLYHIKLSTKNLSLWIFCHSSLVFI